MSKRQVSSDEVVVSSADFLAGEKAIFLEIGDDALDGSFRDADGGGNLSEDHIGLFREQDNDMGVVGEEGPAPFFIQ